MKREAEYGTIAMEDQILINQIKDDNPVAQRQLYDRYRSFWFMICLRYHKNRFDAEDCLQNALVKIYSKLDQFDETRGVFKNWSAQVVTNENLMFLRKQKDLFRFEELDDKINPTVMPEQDDGCSALAPEKLLKLVQNLPKGYRTVFNLYVMEGYTHREIAKILDISEGTSKSQLSKARKMLQHQLEMVF